MSRPMLSDLKYHSLIYGRQIDKERLLKIRSDCLNELMAAFYNNLIRTDSFSVFPAVIAVEASRDQLLRDCAIFKVNGELFADNSGFDAETEEKIRAEIGKLSAAQQQRFVSGEEKPSNYIKRGSDHVRGMSLHELGSHDSIKALLFAVVVESWMSFETLVADLFFTALDNGPARWRINVHRKYAEFSRGSNWEPQKVAPEAANDPQEKYGSSLRDNEMISFQRFRNIKFWYKTAFGDEVEKLFRQVEDGYIRALSAVRNAILHKGGIADATYRKEVDKFTELKGAEEDKAIQLDGEIVRKLRNAAIALGVELILYIDAILTPPPAKS